jgi:tRNA threonylcarbamoyladenosine biosynthesis protein TsaB
MSDALTLAIDASTYAGTVAITRGAEVLAEAEAVMRGETEERLMPAVERVLASRGIRIADLERVVCGSGPGSFTSLRIAASIAKGIALVSGAPLHAVSSLGLVVAAERREPGRYLAVLDAMRGDAYVAFADVDDYGEVVEVRESHVVPTARVQELAAAEDAVTAGAGRTLEAQPRARGVTRMRGICDHGRVDLAAWEPSYGRLAEAQVKWEATHGRALPSR